MYIVIFNDHESIVFDKVNKIEVNDEKGYVKFINDYNEIEALFHLDKIQAFYPYKHSYY